VQLLELLLKVAPEQEVLDKHEVLHASKLDPFNTLILFSPTKDVSGTEVKLLSLLLTTFI